MSPKTKIGARLLLALFILNAIAFMSAAVLQDGEVTLKRSLCNTFTGCGRKRSAPMPSSSSSSSSSVSSSSFRADNRQSLADLIDIYAYSNLRPLKATTANSNNVSKLRALGLDLKDAVAVAVAGELQDEILSQLATNSVADS